jgi:hypothetical protein
MILFSRYSLIERGGSTFRISFVQGVDAFSATAQPNLG